MKPYPIMLNLAGKKAVVIGGGSVAARKVADLLACDAVVTVVAPRIHPDIDAALVNHAESLRLESREYRTGDLEGAFIAFAATGDPSVNRAVYEEAVARGIPVNTADDPEHCTFFVPSWFRRGELTVAVSTGGVSPAYAARVRKEIELRLPDDLEEELAAIAAARRMIRNDPVFFNLDARSRGETLRRIAEDDVLLRELVRRAAAKDMMRDFLLSIVSVSGK